MKTKNHKGRNALTRNESSKSKLKKLSKQQEQINLQDKLNQEKLIQEYKEFIPQMSEIEKQLFYLLADR